MQHNSDFLALIDEIMPQVQEIHAEQVLAKQQAGDDFAFIDVREDHEWQQGHAQGAIHVGRGILERDIAKVVADKQRAIILYCGGGFRSALAAVNLQKMGYQHVFSMAGGMRAWQDLGYPLAQ
jgi:rhodanese-related sulfurtransferase